MRFISIVLLLSMFASCAVVPAEVATPSPCDDARFRALVIQTAPMSPADSAYLELSRARCVDWQTHQYQHAQSMAYIKATYAMVTGMMIVGIVGALGGAAIISRNR